MDGSSHAAAAVIRIAGMERNTAILASLRLKSTIEPYRPTSRRPANTGAARTAAANPIRMSTTVTVRTARERCLDKPTSPGPPCGRPPDRPLVLSHAVPPTRLEWICQITRKRCLTPLLFGQIRPELNSSRPDLT